MSIETQYFVVGGGGDHKMLWWEGEARLCLQTPSKLAVHRQLDDLHINNPLGVSFAKLNLYCLVPGERILAVPVFRHASIESAFHQS